MRTRVVWLTAVLLIGFMGFNPSHAQEVENLLGNGGFEDGVLTPWSTYGNVTTEVVQVLTGAAIPEDPIEGRYCLHVVVPAAGANFWDAGLQPSGEVFAKGKKYTVSAFLKSKKGTLQINMKPELAINPWTGYGEQMMTITEEWAEYSVTTPVFTEDVMPAGFTFHIAMTPGDFWVDGVRFYEGDYVPPAFKKILSAVDPVPEDGAVDVPRDTALSWAPGPFADTHNVYFGKVFDDVNNADVTHPRDVLVSKGRKATAYDPEGLLEFSQTYYWRIDEANAPPDSTVFKGDVWSFMAEPYAYPIANVIATASSSNTQNMGPGKTTDGSGLNASDQHSTEPTDMWLSSATGPQPTWIQYEFDRAYKLLEMWVWNSNQLLESLFGLGAKDVTVEYSEDGVNWTSLGDVEFAWAPGSADYTHDTTVDMAGAIAKYVRLTISSNWRGLLPQYGLSEVRFFYIPVQAREPKPISRGKGVARDVVLDWREGREAASHEVYFSSDSEAVINGTALVDKVSESRYKPASLEYGQTYYWKVNEVNEAASIPSWEGNLWSFSTIEYFVVDDFEDYDVGNNEIWWAWKDGIGYASHPTLPPYPGNGTGSMVGDETTDSYTEETIVHSGNQAMPLYYDNNLQGKFKYSEAELTLGDKRDWTEGGVTVLSLWFHGDPSNAAEPMYVALNGSAVVTHDNPNAALVEQWTEWIIDLQTFADLGVNLANVNTIALGLGDKKNPKTGGSGKMCFDDIRVGRPIPVQVDTRNILANGGFEDGILAPWNTYGNVTTEVIQVLANAAVPEAPIEGNSCLHVVVPTPGANDWDNGLQHAGHVFEAGKKYTLSAFLKCNEGTLQIRFKPELAQEPWTGYGAQVITMTDQWAEYSVTTPVFTADVSPATITFHIGFAAGDFWIDGVRFYEGDYVQPDLGQ